VQKRLSHGKNAFAERKHAEEGIVKRVTVCTEKGRSRGWVRFVRFSVEDGISQDEERGGGGGRFSTHWAILFVGENSMGKKRGRKKGSR